MAEITFVIGTTHNQVEDTSSWCQHETLGPLSAWELPRMLRCGACQDGDERRHGTSQCPVESAIADAVAAGWGHVHTVSPIVDNDGWVREHHMLVTIIRLDDGEPFSLPELSDADRDGAWPVAGGE